MARGKKRTGPSARPVQVGEQVRQVLSDVLRDGALKDPRIEQASLVTVTEVAMTPDLKTARVFVSIYGEEPAAAEVLEGLNAASGAAQRQIADRLKLRFTPKVEFRRDESIAYGAKIEAILQEIQDGDDEEAG
jgi:ribosome-binding factor A